MARQNAFDRSARLVAEGRLVVLHVDSSSIEALCRGDSGEIWRLGYERGVWHCACPALSNCAHMFALWRVTVRPGSPR